VYAFTSNRGGVGKSFLVSQTAAAVAASNLLRTVVVLDLSIQGDASVALLGGVHEPLEFSTGVSTRGMENISKVPAERTARGFLEAVAAKQPTKAFWRGMAPAAPFDWRAHVVSVAEAYPAGGAPPNLYVAPGGASLHGAPLDPLALVEKVRAALPADAVVLVDTDAELSERPPSLLGLAVADSVCVVASASWSDVQRLLSDPVNSLFAALAHVSQALPGYRGVVSTFVFNNLSKVSKEPYGHLPFTPPANTLRTIADICAFVDNSPLASRFLAPHSDFFADLVAAVAVVPDGPKLVSLDTGCALVSAPRTEAEQTAAKVIEALAAHFT